MEISKEEISAIVKNAVAEAVTAKNDADRIAHLEATVASLRNAMEEKEKEEKKDEAKNEKEDEKEKKDEAKNEDDKKEKDEEKKGETVENAKPSQALISAVATAMNIDFGRSTPSFAQIAKLMGIDEADPFARIVAVNAKFAGMPATAANAKETKSTVEVF